MAKVEIQFIPETVQVSDGKFKATLLAKTSSKEISVKGRIEIIGLAKDQEKVIKALNSKILKLS